MSQNQHISYMGKQSVLPELGYLCHRYFNTAEPNGRPAHNHPTHYEIILITGGRVHWWVEDRTYDVGRGTLFVVRPGEFHGATNAVYEPCEIYGVSVRKPDNHTFPGMTADASALITQTFDHLQRHTATSQSSIQPSFERLLAEHAQRTPLSPVAARAALHEILVATARTFESTYKQTPPQPNDQHSPMIQQAIDYIHQHLADLDSVARIATAIGVTEKRLSQRFMDEVGFTPVAYLAHCRVQEAQRRLTGTNATITEIALALGFSSSQYFSTTFRKLVGISPAAFREQAANANTTTPSNNRVT